MNAQKMYNLNEYFHLCGRNNGRKPGQDSTSAEMQSYEVERSIIEK